MQLLQPEVSHFMIHVSQMALIIKFQYLSTPQFQTGDQSIGKLVM
jgi:hypothetical protein